MTIAEGARHRPGPRRRLSEDHVLDAALDLLAEGGLTSLNIRSVVRRLDASPGTFYTYFATKDALLESIMVRAMRDVGTAPLVGDWRVDLRALVTELHDAFRACPTAITLLGAGYGTERLDHVRERLLGLLELSGLAPAQRLQAQDALVAHAIGDVVVLHSPTHKTRGGEPARRRALPPKEFPQLVLAASLDPAPSPAATYDLGLDALISAIGDLAGS